MHYGYGRSALVSKAEVNEMAFNVGDVVVLKSGGASMTVEVPGTATGKVYCVWHNQTSPGCFTNSEHAYPEGALELLSDVHARNQAESDRIDRAIDAAQREY